MIGSAVLIFWRWKGINLWKEKYAI